MAETPPPPPPPHGEKHSRMPDGNYDIFIHAPGSGMIYLPSLQCHRNSFLAGVAFAYMTVAFWSVLYPALKRWSSSIASGGSGIILLVAAVGVGAWAWGKTQGENASSSGSGTSGGASGQGGPSGQHQSTGNQSYTYGGGPGHDPGNSNNRSGPRPSPAAGTKQSPSAGAASGWEKAREETRKREEERKKAEQIKKKQEEAQKAKEDKERAVRAAAEKEKWEQARAREKDAREREARERITKEKVTRERAKATTSSNTKYERPTAQSCNDDTEETSYRPYDTPKNRRNPLASSASSASGLSESSYAASQSTARTTPPPSHRGPYSTKDPDKIVIKGVYLFNNMFPKPISQLVSGQASVTDGLILRITTEGLFIDDDVRGVPQREWDVKAWGMKLIEVCLRNQFV